MKRVRLWLAVCVLSAAGACGGGDEAPVEELTPEQQAIQDMRNQQLQQMMQQIHNQPMPGQNRPAQ